MKLESPEFRTRKGHRVYKRSRVASGSVVYADTYTLRVKQDGSTSYFKLGTSKREAGALADEIMAFLDVDGNTVEEALIRYSETHRNRAIRKQKAPEPVVEILTVGALIDTYLSITAHLSSTTRRNNTQALRHWAAAVLGLPKLGVNQTKDQQTKWRAKVHSFPLSGFTHAAIEGYRQRELAALGGDHRKIGAACTTLNSYLRAAKGVFSKKILPQYAGVNLSDPLPFVGISALPEPSHRYKSKINVTTLIADAKAILKESSPDAWIAFLLCIGAGLRREELDKLQWEQVDFDEKKIWIHTTEFFRPKAKNSDAYVDLSDSLISYLLQYREKNKERRFVLPGKEVSGKIRCAKTFSALMKWLRGNGVSERTPLHTLRKEAGSLVFQKAAASIAPRNFFATILAWRASTT